MYKTLSCYDAERDGIKFKLEDLDFIINKIGCDLENHRTLSKDDSDESFAKDDPYPVDSFYHLKYITNGEYYWGIYKCLLNMINDEPDNIDAPLKVMLYSPIQIGLMLLVDDCELDDDYVNSDKSDLLKIHNRIEQLNGRGFWKNKLEENITKQQLSELKTEEGCKKVSESVLDELFPDREDYFYLDHFSKYDWEPYFPSHQEYRKALIWLESAFAKTNANNRGK